MFESRRTSRRFGIELALAVIAFGGILVMLSGLHVTRAGFEDDDKIADTGRQVTVFGVLATSGAKTTDSRLSSIIQKQLAKLLPDRTIQAPGCP